LQSVDLNGYVPHFELEVDGDKELGRIIRSSTISISVREEFSQVTSFTLIVADHFHVDRQEFTWLDSDALKPGKTIKIKLGYTNNLAEIMEGQISTTTTSGFTSEPPRLTVNGFHKGHKELTEPSSGDRPIRLEREDTYSRIAEKLSESIGLKKDVDLTKKYAPIIMKKPIVYNDFLKEKAKRVGYEYFVTRDTLFFIDPRKIERIAQGVVFEWGTNIVQFVPSINTADLVSEVEFRGHTPVSRKKIVVKVPESAEDTEDVVETGKKKGSQIAREIDRKGKKGKKKDITDQNVSSENEGRDLARAELNSTSDKLITATLSIIGDSKLMPGQIIEIKRVGRTFEGRYFVTQATHTIDGNGYTTTLNVRRNVM
jgi:uncharacterized protein